MPDRDYIGLDNPAFRGRLRQPVTASQRSFRPVAVQRSQRPAQYVNNDVVPPKAASGPERVANNTPQAPEVELIPAQPYAKPAQARPQQTRVLARTAVMRPKTIEAALQPEPAIADTVQPDVEQERYFEPIVTSLPLKRSRLQLALMGMGITVFIVGMFVSIMTLQTNNNAKAQVAAIAQKSQDEGTSDVPSEAKPKGIGAYSVAPTLPKFIKIPSLQVNARVKPMGVTSSNELQAPTNIFDAGWYNASAHPGDDGTTGAVLIDGHVHGPTLPGVFANIKNLTPGSLLQIVRGDDKVFTYKVVKIQEYDAKNMDLGVALGSAQPGKPGLNLITCGGSYDHTSSQYTKRTVVFAVQQS